ncbi:Heat shock protein 83 [Bienertia sinuspersici]
MAPNAFMDSVDHSTVSAWIEQMQLDQLVGHVHVEYMEERWIKDLVKKHSEFISYPIYLWTEHTTEKEISDDEDDKLKKEEEGDVEDVSEDKDKKKKKKIKEVSHEWHLINKQEPIWLCQPKEITKDDYASFYENFLLYLSGAFKEFHYSDKTMIL